MLVALLTCAGPKTTRLHMYHSEQNGCNPDSIVTSVSSIIRKRTTGLAAVPSSSSVPNDKLAKRIKQDASTYAKGTEVIPDNKDRYQGIMNHLGHS